MIPILRGSTALFLTYAVFSVSVLSGCSKSEKPAPAATPDASQAAPAAAPADQNAAAPPPLANEPR